MEPAPAKPTAEKASSVVSSSSRASSSSSHLSNAKSDDSEFHAAEMAARAAGAAAQIQSMAFASTDNLSLMKPISIRSTKTARTNASKRSIVPAVPAIPAAFKSNVKTETSVVIESTPVEEIDEDAADRDDENINTEKSALSQMTLQRQILTLSAMAMSVFIGSLDQTIVASSMPAIAEEFDALPSVSWIATGFLLASTAMQPLYGRLSDIFGRIETLMVGLVIFLVGSAVAGAATSIDMLIGGRVVQGLGASALVSLVMVIVSDITIERERGKITSIFSAIWAASSVLGPVLGGLFTESRGGWPWVFYFSLPVGAVAGVFIAVFLRLPRPRGSFREKLRRVDFIGMAVLVTGIVMALLALNFGGANYAWSSPTVLCLLIFGIAIVGVFVVIEWKIPAEPIMPLRLFRSRNVGLVLVMQLFVGAVMFGPTFYVPIYFSVVHNSSAIAAGLHLLPYILPITIFSTIAGFAVAKTGRYRELIWLGGAIATVGAGLFALMDETTNTGKSIGLILCGGAGMGLILQPMLLALQTAIQPRDMATGTTLFVAIRTLGGSIGLAVFQTVQQNKLAPLIAELVRQYPQYKDLIKSAVKNQAVIRASDTPPEITQALIDAYVRALRAVFYASIPFAAMIVVLGVFVRHIPLRTRMAKPVED
ncbi:hypothetical protein GGH94_003114 [Coemansia aciculifera]|uniref:Major facilitator superfamily (MFS) profile domain-containing protein n=1 Tax=Coemansia aciculifera TaxID=417176 RepID=A0A9W8M5D7_9FUNG|nr:hypothetical protein GGH94_003114 [Coemansia aciculifera]KAJ2871116.1 hypothetical protein GGH93_005070 [Coemansia aciculifera]